MSKRAELLELIDSDKPHITFGAETWLSHSILNNEIIPDYVKATQFIVKTERTAMEESWYTCSCTEIYSITALTKLWYFMWNPVGQTNSKDIHAAIFYRPHLSELMSVEQLNISLEEILFKTH